MKIDPMKMDRYTFFLHAKALVASNNFDDFDVLDGMLDLIEECDWLWVQQPKWTAEAVQEQAKALRNSQGRVAMKDESKPTCESLIARAIQIGQITISAVIPQKVRKLSVKDLARARHTLHCIRNDLPYDYVRRASL